MIPQLRSREHISEVGPTQGGTLKSYTEEGELKGGIDRVFVMIEEVHTVFFALRRGGPQADRVL